MTTTVSKPQSQPRPSGEPVEKRTLGGMEGKIRMSLEFDEPDEELMELIENSTIFPDEG